MSTSPRQTGLLWPVYTVPTHRLVVARKLEQFGTQETAQKQRASRYERFTTNIVVASSVLMLLFTALLHLLNYELDTQTSSTSGTHSGFSNTTETDETETQE